MQDLLATLQTWQLHPVINHFTVAILTIAVLTDLIASLLSTRMWLRYMALTLTVIGAAAAAGSYATGDAEAERLNHLLKTLQGPAKDLFSAHAGWGEWLMYIFAVLALWRIAIQVLGFLAGSRPLYLLATIIAMVLLFIQAWRGGELVFEYGIGTMPWAAATATPSATPTPSAPGVPAIPNALPTVFNPPATTPMTPTPSATPSARPSAAASGSV